MITTKILKSSVCAESLDFDGRENFGVRQQRSSASAELRLAQAIWTLLEQNIQHSYDVEEAARHMTIKVDTVYNFDVDTNWEIIGKLCGSNGGWRRLRECSSSAGSTAGNGQ